MQRYLTAIQAAHESGRGEKTIRLWLASGVLPGRKRGRTWRIDPDDLARVCAERGLEDARETRSELEQMQAQLADALTQLAIAHRRIDELEARPPAIAAPAPSYSSLAIAAPRRAEAPTITAIPRSVLSASGAFRSKAELGAWLERHGVNYSTARSWRGCPMTPAGALAYAITKTTEAAGKARGRMLHPCGDAACCCVEMLGDDLADLFHELEGATE